ncbi:SDR family oxidoreductase [Salinimicrobium tongyeongense]|uniref:SDR family oxidoreductase n=1 Tax=Salinimicrobium tongyeongense TaxID=2809707 RepID=A0ABY6NRI1_9FLAO|nr:SDR family oxidoreductase [Salinimicrobium tongyeongense]UZH55521.1 SDR family oxidoreductase [Salinimicrobium tongyeongense]
MKVKNKVVLVTGSNGLIGKQVVTYLKEAGARVIGLDITKKGNSDSTFISCDVSKKEEIDDAIDDVERQYGRIDGLVNLAYPRTSDWGTKFEDVSLKSWQENVDYQMNSVFYICQRVLKIMKKQKSGSIVNIGSIYGVVGNDFSLYEGYNGSSPAAYTAIKGGIINLTRFLASYYGRYNVRINCVSPGGVLDKDNQHPSFIERYSEKSPLKRLANPEEIAPPIVFLLSDEASFITGHNMMVDGGWTAI